MGGAGPAASWPGLGQLGQDQVTRLGQLGQPDPVTAIPWNTPVPNDNNTAKWENTAATVVNATGRNI